jgi:hypothetical protein
MREFADKYSFIGLSCLPCKLDKSPYLKESWNRKFESKEFEGVPAIGIKCGKESDGLECLDIDNHNGTAKENLSNFIDEIKTLYDKYKFPIEKTQGGGYHILYKCDFIEGNLKLASVPKKNEKDKWVPDAIFETRGEGGYFVAFPSKGYTVIKNDILNIPKISKEEREIIIQTAKSFNTWTQIIPTEYEQTDKPGDKFNSDPLAIQEIKSLLRGAGWKELGKFNWIRPGKKEGISATFGKVADNCFYVFSANAFPFDQNSGYNPFSVLALLKYNGDYKACAKDLALRYEMKSTRIENKTDNKPIKVEKTESELDALLKKSFIDTDIEFNKPPVILYINDSEGSYVYRKRLFTLGNFSAIIGKAKTRKTFFMSMITAALVNGDNSYRKFYANLPNDKPQVLYFDTEQGLYDSANVMKRIERIAGSKSDHFAGFNIREYSPLERCDIIEHALNKFKNIGFVIIDGVADLATAINSEEEATRVSGLMLRWTKQYNCHICTAIHQNKNDNFATGHLGSSIMKKAEMVLSLSKEKGSSSNSIVSCDLSRGIDFEEFGFLINKDGLPELSCPITNEQEITQFYD